MALVTWSVVMVAVALAGALWFVHQRGHIRHDLLYGDGYHTHAMAAQAVALMTLLWGIAGAVILFHAHRSASTTIGPRVVTALLTLLMLAGLTALIDPSPYADPEPFGLTLDDSLQAAAADCGAVGLLAITLSGIVISAGRRRSRPMP